ncbi:MAG: hypothetical protein MUC42_07800 [Bryobacter sp.]|nr:hypothetical protein [Bryobacter sp.]
MATIPPFVEGQIEALSRLLGECGSGTDISRVLHDRGLVDNSGESTKWRRLYRVFLDCQNRHGCADPVVDFIRAFLTPARFVGRSQDFEARRRELNAILAFSGLEYGADGQVREVEAAATLDEAERRVRTIRSKFQGRRMHPEVVKYCSAELMQDIIIPIETDEEGWEVVRPYIERQKVNYRMVIATEEVAQLYGGVESLPTSFILDREGRIASAHVGLVSKKEYQDDIEQLLAAPAR